MKNLMPAFIISLVFLTDSLSWGATVLAHYTFNNSANMTADASGNGHVLAVVAGYGTPGYSASGKFGGASTFDGSTQGWIINDNIYPAGSFSFAAWVNPQGPVTMISQPWSMASGFDVYAGAGSYRFMTRYDSSLYSYKVASVGPVIGEWQHIAMTFEVTSGPDVDASGTYTGTIKGYVNGVLVATLAGAQYDRASANDMAIGRRSTSAFNGLIDEVYVFEGVLTDTEIQALMAPSVRKASLSIISSP